MKIFKLIVDLLLICMLIMILNHYLREPDSDILDDWQNPLQKLPWKNCEQIEFPSQNYTIQLGNSSPRLHMGTQSWQLEFSRVQKFLDNWLILPEYKTLSIDPESDYGFGQAADLRLNFRNQSISIFMGRSVPGMNGSFYVSTSSESVFTLPSALRSSLLWQAIQFLPKKPFEKNPRKIELPSEIMGQELHLEAHSESWTLTNQQSYHQPHRVVHRLTQLSLEPTINSTELGAKIATIHWDHNPIQIHDSGFFDSNKKLGWLHTPASRNWIKNLSLELMSPILTDHEPGLLKRMQRLEYSSGKILKPEDSIFSFYLKKLRQFSGEVIRKLPPTTLKSFSIQCVTDSQIFTISGLQNEQIIAFSISENLYLLSTSKAVLP